MHSDAASVTHHVDQVLSATALCMAGAAACHTPPSSALVMAQSGTCCVAQVHALLAAGIPVAEPFYVIEWLAQPWRPPSAHLLFGCVPGPALAEAEAGRAGPPGADEGSMSF